MSSLIDRILPDGRRLADSVFAPVEVKQQILNFIDVCARNNSYMLSNAYAARRRPDRNTMNAETMHRLWHACMAMDFNAFRLNLMRDAGLVATTDIDAVEAEANRPPLRRRPRLAWESTPATAAKILNGLRR